MSLGTLYICATPIGNLDDASFRLINTLSEADLIVAEDTRTIKKILLRFEIKKPQRSLISYQDYSSSIKIEHILNSLRDGKNIALVSESGTPAIQDPGYKIIRDCIDAGIKISVIPGPNAALSALVLSGLPTDSFLFIGFLPKKPAKIREKIEEVKFQTSTLIFYESPLRTVKLLEMLFEILGDRNCCVARELTKIFEEVLRGKISEIIVLLKGREKSGRKLKGEIVVVVDGHNMESIKDYSENEIKNHYKKLICQNFSRKEALKILKSKYDIERSQLYNITLKI